jgi:hypothetical protein
MLTINHWRASLVPAAAVIPAPIAYANVVAVKKLVVGFLRVSASSVLRDSKVADSPYFASVLGWDSFLDRASGACLL